MSFDVAGDWHTSCSEYNVPQDKCGLVVVNRTWQSNIEIRSVRQDLDVGELIAQPGLVGNHLYRQIKATFAVVKPNHGNCNATREEGRNDGSRGEAEVSIRPDIPLATAP